MDRASRPFNLRAFTALMIAFTGLGLPLTGIYNHVYGFDGLSVARHAWMAAHNVLGVLFVIFGVWHVVLNRRVLGAYLRSAAARVSVVSREAAVAGVGVIAALVLLVGHAFHAPH